MFLVGSAAADPRVEALATDDPRALSNAVAAIERARSTPEVAEMLLAAARACEDRLFDPARALAIYDRIVRELPDARVAAAAQRRGDQLRTDLGPDGRHGPQASELARLVATADALSADAVIASAEALSRAGWPGAPRAMLWLADWSRRTGRIEDARRRYASVVERWPSSPQAIAAMRGAAGAALDARDWSTAEQLAARLPANTAADRHVRDDVLDTAANGRTVDRVYLGAWLALAAAILVLIGSLAEAGVRGGPHWPPLRPPVEVTFLAPVAAVLVGVALVTDRTIAPAVAWVSVSGVACAWVSGTTMELLRTRSRAIAARAIAARAIAARAVAQVAACILAAVSVGAIVVIRGELLDVVIETLRFGPEP